MNKICSKCNINKAASEFSKSQRGLGGLHTYCKSCQKVQDRAYWQRKKHDSERMLARKRLSDSRKNELQDYVFSYLTMHHCQCGEKNPLYLEFDHLENKTDTISNMVRRQVSLKRLKQEIEKCQVLCVKCHRLKTAKDFNWWILSKLSSSLAT